MIGNSYIGAREERLERIYHFKEANKELDRQRLNGLFDIKCFKVVKDDQEKGPEGLKKSRSTN